MYPSTENSLMKQLWPLGAITVTMETQKRLFNECAGIASVGLIIIIIRLDQLFHLPIKRFINE